MQEEKIYDLAGIGIGPFNLGLAALAATTPLNTIFVEQNDAFQWHPGLLLRTAKMQVPFYADLVTLADPTSAYSYLNYLKATGQLFRFAINESYFPYRTEFNKYGQWVAGQLNNLRFGWRCLSVHYQERRRTYLLVLQDRSKKTKTITAKHLVLGMGSIPHIPDCAREIHHPLIFHASEYLSRRNAALMHNRITIVGSGQSAAEIFADLLPHLDDLEELHWITRSDRFHPMDYSKLSLELSTPDYIRYFYHLSGEKKNETLRGQQYLYRGINASLIETIYEQLYLRSLHTAKMPLIRTNCSLEQINVADPVNIDLTLRHTPKEETINLRTNAVILATGYKNSPLTLLKELDPHIRYDTEGRLDIRENYSIDHRNTLFVQNAETHTHGFNSADLGLGPYRNAVILNTVLKTERFKLEEAGAFQVFR